MTHPAKTYTLVADIGGTNTRIALAAGPQLLPDTVRRYSNSDFQSLSAVISRYILDENQGAPRAACVAVAGPVEGHSARLTNLDWAIDLETLAAATRTQDAAILNDLQAQGYALDNISTDNLINIVAGQPCTNATQLVVGIGTGFNAAPVFETPNGRFVAPSEAGHADLPIRTAEDLRLGIAISDPAAAPSIEEALSGRGLPNIYAALFPMHQPCSGRDILDRASAGDRDADLAVRTFVQLLGAVCGNLALIYLPIGGINLVGGMARAMLPFLGSHGFETAFTDKGRFAEFMRRFAVNVIVDDYAALAGCAAFMHHRTA